MKIKIWIDVFGGDEQTVDLEKSWKITNEEWEDMSEDEKYDEIWKFIDGNLSYGYRELK